MTYHILRRSSRLAWSLLFDHRIDRFCLPPGALGGDNSLSLITKLVLP